MKILFIYRNPKMGFSIGKVFAPIESELRKRCEVDSIYMPAMGYGLCAIWRNIRAVQKRVKGGGYDLIHITGTENYLLPYLKRYKVVVTVHDLASFTNNCYGLRLMLKRAIFIDTLRFADAVTFISDKSRCEMESAVDLSSTRLEVIYNPVDPSYKYEPKVFNRDRATILHIGTTPNKNLLRVIYALESIQCRLRIIGRLTDQMKSTLSECDIDYSATSDISDAEMLDEYKRCDIVSFPSLYEGFGMPIIEGQSVGRVVVTSDLSPMREVANGAAILVDPHNIESIMEGFREAINSSNRYVLKGIKNVQDFQLTTIVGRYYSLYCELLERDVK